MQKEQLSALMDGEALDQSLLSALAKDESLQKSWESYHLIRDTMRGDVAELISFDISSRVAEAIALEPRNNNVSALIPESQPEPARWRRMSFFRKSGTWGAQLAQVGVAACVSLAVLVGVQHYNHPAGSQVSDSDDSPAFNTMPMMGKASPVSLGVQGDIFDDGVQTQKVQQQRVRVNAMLQDYELQRRLNQSSVSQH